MRPPLICRMIAHRWHLGMNTLEIGKALNLKESEVYNRLPRALRLYPKSAFPMTFHVKQAEG